VQPLIVSDKVTHVQYNDFWMECVTVSRECFHSHEARLIAVCHVVNFACRKMNFRQVESRERVQTSITQAASSAGSLYGTDVREAWAPTCLLGLEDERTIGQED
jgi:hypothetical protein